jgi:hypothetical protein
LGCCAGVERIVGREEERKREREIVVKMTVMIARH